ncbi:hypothetical protein ES708_25747 [subsurface metagenome]
MDLADHRHTPDEGGVLYEGYIRYAEVEISVAEILDLFTTPKELVAAPGAGKVLELISLELALGYVSAAYGTTDVGNIAVHYTDASGAAVSVDLASAGFIDQATDQLRLIQKIATNVTPVVNAALVLAVDGTADPTGGDSPIHAKIAYRVHETGL